jgi:hypothetical protein
MLSNSPDISKLKDIKDIKINMELQRTEKIIDYLRQTGNSHFCKYDDIIIELIFSKEEFTLTDKMKQCLRMSK